MKTSELYETYKENGSIQNIFENGMLTVNNYIPIFTKQQEINKILTIIVSENEDGLKEIKAMDYEVAEMLSMASLYINGLEFNDEIDGDELVDMLTEMGVRDIIYGITNDAIKYADMFHEEVYRVVYDYNSTGAVLNRHLTQLNSMLGGLAEKLTNVVDDFNPTNLKEYTDVLSSMNDTVQEVKKLTK